MSLPHMKHVQFAWFLVLHFRQAFKWRILGLFAWFQQDIDEQEQNFRKWERPKAEKPNFPTSSPRHAIFSIWVCFNTNGLSPVGFSL